MKKLFQIWLMFFVFASVGFAQYRSPYDKALEEVKRRNREYEIAREKEEQARARENRAMREREDVLQQHVSGSLEAAGGITAILQWPRWKTPCQWYENRQQVDKDAQWRGWYTESTRANGLIIGPDFTILFYEFKVNRAGKRLEYWWSSGTYLEGGGVRLPFAGAWSQGKLHWLTNDDGSVSHWGWDDPKPEQIYSCMLVFAGRLPRNAASISLRESETEGIAKGYTQGSIEISPPDQPRRYSGMSEVELRGKVLRNNDPIEGIYEDAGRNSFRFGVLRNENGQYSVIYLKNGKHYWWGDGEIKAILYPTAARGAFKADWTDEAFYKNTTALVSFDGATMKVLGNELPLDDGSEEMVFIKVFPSENDAVASALAKDLPEVFKLQQWTATNNWYHNESAHERIRVNGMIVSPKATVLWLEMQVDEDRESLKYFASKNACLKVGEVKLPFVGHWTNNERLQVNINADGSASDWGWDNPEKGKSYFYNMVFAGKLPVSLSPGKYVPISIDDSTGTVHGYSLTGIMISPPWEERRFSGMSEMELRQRLFHGKDPIEGIYENTGPSSIRLGVFRSDNGRYAVVHLVNGKHRWWKEGEIKATLHPSATRGIFKADWLDEAFYKNATALVSFDGATMKVLGNELPMDDGSEEMLFIKMYPSDAEVANAGDEEQEVTVSGGSGFALKFGYLVTNNHVVDGATDIKVWRSGDDGEISSKAEVVYSDAESDIAVLKTAFHDDKVPFKVKDRIADVGTEVFALGYPLTSTMGKEMKMTSGVISSTKGFLDDPSLYQISAAVQPGNSGGPLFDKSGALVGVVVAKHGGAENASYAIKGTKLLKLLQVAGFARAVPDGNTFFVRNVPDKVKRLGGYVYRIECSIGGSFDEGNKKTIWYPKVREPHCRKVTVEGGVIPYPSDLVVVRVVQNKDSTMVEIGGKCLKGAWLKRKTFLESNNKMYMLSKVEGLSHDPHSDDSVPDDYAFKTFKAYFPPLPAGTKSVDFIEPPGHEGENPFVIKGISLIPESSDSH